MYGTHLGPNRGIGRQKSNRARLVPSKQNGGLPQETSRFVFNDAVGRRREKNGQQNSVPTQVTPREGSNGRMPVNFPEAGCGGHAEIL